MLDIAIDRGPSSYGSPTIPVVSGPTLDGVVSPLSGVGSLDSSRGRPTLYCRILGLFS